MDDSAEILFQSFLQEALVSSSGMGRDVHFLEIWLTPSSYGDPVYSKLSQRSGILQALTEIRPAPNSRIDPVYSKLSQRSGLLQAHVEIRPTPSSIDI